MSNLSHFKLTDDWGWYYRYADLMGEMELKAYINKVYIKLDSMAIGDIFYIEKSVKKENWELFIKAAGWYQMDIRKGNRKDDVAFNVCHNIIFKYKCHD